jgi:hypothetical protein
MAAAGPIADPLSISVPTIHVSINDTCDHMQAIRNSTIYETEIMEFKSCQGAARILTDEGCEKYILKNINKAECTYDEDADKIVVMIPFEDMHLRFILSRAGAEISVERRIEMLEKQIQQLDPYETVCFNEYPKWDTYEEFIKLPEFKYIKASWDFNKKEKLFQYDDFHYNIVGRLEQFNNLPVAMFSKQYIWYEVNLSKIAGIDGCGDIKCKETNICSKCFMKGDDEEDYKSSVAVNDRTCRFGHISKEWLRYCTEFIHGFLILEYRSFIYESIRVELIAKNTTSKIIIKRSKNPVIINDDESIDIPKPKIIFDLFGTKFRLDF